MAKRRTSWLLSPAFLAMLFAVPIGNPASLRAESGDDQFAVAAAHYSAGRWQLAADEFRSYLEDHPRHPKIAKAEFYLGETWVQLGRFEIAAQQFVRLVEHHPSSSHLRQATFRAGESALFAADHALAKTWLDRFAEKYPNDELNAHALKYRGEIALARHAPTDAARHYAESLTRFPQAATRHDAKLGLAQAKFRLKQHGAAQKLLAELIVDSQTPKQLLLESNYWLGQTHKADERWNAAAAAFQAAIDLDPQHPATPALRYQAADAQLRAGGFSAALNTLQITGPATDQSLTSLETLPASHRYLAALAHQGLQQHDAALDLLEKLPDQIESELAASVWLAQATSLMAAKRDLDAIAALDKCLSKVGEHDLPVRIRALSQLALVHARHQNVAQSRAALDKLLAIAPAESTSLSTIEQLADLAKAAGQNDWAVELYQRLADEKNPPNVAARGLSGLAWSQLSSGQTASATDTFQRLLAQHPDDPRAADAAIACGQALEKLQKHDAALDMYQRVIVRYTGSTQLPLALLSAARLHDQLQQELDASPLYERLIVEHPDSLLVDAALYGWAWCLRELQEPNRADEKFLRLHDEFRSSRFWPDATYRLAQSASGGKQYDRAIDLLDLLIAAGDQQERAKVSNPIRSEKSAAALRDKSIIAPEMMQHALYLRAQSAANAGRLPEAETDLARLLVEHRQSPLQHSARWLQADVVYRRGDFTRAGELLDRLAEELDSKSRLTPQVLLRRGQVFAQQKQWDEAKAAAQRLKSDFPNFDHQYEADYLLGRCWAAEAKFDDARRSYLQVVRSAVGGKTETAAMAQWMIGETYFHQEDYAVAVREYMKVEILYAYPRWQAGALLQAGKCQERLAQFKDAGELYARLVKMFPDTEFTDEAKQRLELIQARTANNKR